tara:strand:+ start:5254 stop:5598 length:345 start_codon:yes stop_codon:yes gene_type:complete
MKKKITLILLFFLLLNSSSAQIFNTKKYIEETFEVLGNCDMCRKKIQNASIKLRGVKKAIWSAKEEKLTIKYNPEKISLEKIKQSIADEGYDTDEIKATQEAYENLHYCCKYKR